MEQWYTLHTKPNAEYQVVAALQQRDIQTYLPEMEIPKTCPKPRRKKPYFPCYVFSKVDFEAVGISQVQWTPGLRRIVSFDDRPVPLPDEVIDLIRHRLGEIETNGGWPIHTFKSGDIVRITDGTFQDMLAIFDGPTTPSERVQVLLNILGHASRVQIDLHDLERVSDATQAPQPQQSRRTRGRGRRISRN